LKLAKRSVTLDIEKYSFSDMVVNEWDMLNEKNIESSFLSVFKRNRVIIFVLIGVSLFFPLSQIFNNLAFES